MLSEWCDAGGVLAGAVLVGLVQGHVAHAVYWLWEVPAAVAHGHVAHNALHDQWRHLLRALPWPRHQPHPVPRLLSQTVSRKGKPVFIGFYNGSTSVL